MQGLLLAGRYRLADSIGSGGMGRVWRARDEVLHRSVAIKELTAALYVSESEQAVLLARTRAEARAAARINHSAVVTVHDVLEHDGRPWIVMELVEGGSLADAVKDAGRIEPREAARVGLWVLRALRAAHSAGVLHRDVKPGNVLISHDRRVLLTDFGIAQVEGDTTITRTGEIVGSVDYLAPERIRGQDPGPSADLWALGATLYTAVEGRSPFRRTTPLTTMQAVVGEEPDAPENAGPLTSVITALLRKDPAERPGPDEAEQMLAEAAEGRAPDAAQAYVPTQHGDSARDPRGTYGQGIPGAYGPAQPAGASGSGASGSTASGSAGPGFGGAGSEDATHAVAHGSQGSHGFNGSAGGQYPQSPGSYGGPDGRDTYGSHGRPAPDPAVATANQPAVVGRSGRRRFRTVAAVVLAAALVGGGGVAAMLLADGWGDDDASNSSNHSSPPRTPSPSGSGGEDDGKQTEAAQTGDVPAGWERVDDPEGFSLVLPEGWKRQVEGTQVDYTPDAGEHFVRIAVDDSPDFDNPYRHLVDLEQQISGRLSEYQRVGLESNTFRDRPGALWDFTWTALGKDTEFPGPRRAIEQAYLGRDGVEYVIYMSAPADDWGTAREQFDTVLRGWQVPES
ncbi:serine/threonine protein kinase [Streptomyces dioscori]|uniref:non-specific serine/threonine protein kinase n=1 Tax=Streptomyces dioscori TaxID=2109333 RepID=A0A2P8QD49_9ACTN|nr:serine/threonine-protein kinase [Streptomyces dioscori]PSM44182.1 serine/threonine protein kinase [Streptomyces dioscori]